MVLSVCLSRDREAYDRRPHRRVRHTKRTSLCDNRPRCREWSAPVHCPGRDVTVITVALQGIAGDIRSVVSDFAPAMAKAVAHVFPDAKHVLDRFHLIQFFTDALRRRRRFLNEARRHHHVRVIDRALACRPETLSPEDREVADSCLRERSVHPGPLSRTSTYPICAEGHVPWTGDTSTDRLVGSLSVPSLRASGEDREIDPEPRGSDASNDRVQSIERKDGRNEQQDRAHQTPWLWLSKP